MHLHAVLPRSKVGFPGIARDQLEGGAPMLAPGMG